MYDDERRIVEILMAIIMVLIVIGIIRDIRNRDAGPRLKGGE